MLQMVLISTRWRMRYLRKNWCCAVLHPKTCPDVRSCGSHSLKHNDVLDLKLNLIRSFFETPMRFELVPDTISLSFSNY